MADSLITFNNQAIGVSGSALKFSTFNESNIAPAYDNTSTYVVGDLVMYDGNLYQCNTAIGTAEAWTAAHWTQKDVETLLASKLEATKCTFQTTAPSAAITDGGVHIVYLSSEPGTKYNGYIYLIAE